MKKHTLIAGLLTLCPISVMAAIGNDIPVYIVEFCDSNNLDVQHICTGTPCQESAIALTHTQSGSYTAYTHCAPFYVKDTVDDTPLLLCFKDITKCHQFTACHEDYMAATKPDIEITYFAINSPSNIKALTDAYYQCCNSGCSGVAGSVTNYGNIGTAKAKKCFQSGSSQATCSTSGDAVDTVAFCASGYYATGKKYVTVGSTNPHNATNTLKCTACPIQADTYTNADKTVAATASTSPGADSALDCFLTAGAYYDNTGGYSFSNSCGFGK